MIDGRGAIWRPGAVNPIDLWSYTLGHQVVKPYDFTAAIRVAARELMPDVFIVLGPGNTLGGAVAQSLIACNWRGMHDKDSFKTQADRLLSLGA
jgi:[acyl-carrier-protein] S-malonyltransferase